MITTAFLIKQVATANDKPILFACSDGKEYWVKDQQGGRKRRALIDEWIGASLAREMSIPVPDWEAIQLIPESYEPSIIQPKGRKLTHGVCFGSNNIQNMIDFSDQTINLKSKRIFDQVTNPEDFIRIAIFDLWVANGDRNANNYNLIMKRQPEELTFYAIDHSFMFEDHEFSNISLELNSFQDDTGSLLGTNAHKSLLKRIGLKKARDVGSAFFESINVISEVTLRGIFQNVPAAWQFNTQEQNYVKEFLLMRRNGLYTELKTRNIVR
jgi:hypothetical protein